MSLQSGSTPTNLASTLELSLALPRALPGSRIHLRLTLQPKTLLLFLSSSSGEGTQQASLGTFVYAMPDRYNPTQPLSTSLYTSPSSAITDSATRMAKILARRTGRAVYVGNSCSSFAAASSGDSGGLEGIGGVGGGEEGGFHSLEDEMEGFRRVVDVVLREVKREEEEGRLRDGDGGEKEVVGRVQGLSVR
ncbi:hypothetical protein AAFC00_003061 [Neodothiora populina]|uniref:Uncharacterized protein n=1 Tax=Neodothiora populina TaxID=2781224 RepID=A0ABR3P9F2_9PEZI